MSERGVDFLQGWIHEHLPGELPVDKATARTLTTRAALDARHLGLEVSEIEEDLGPLERVIFEALDQPDI
ncbi:DUF768 domain-containing protein [Mesorhizobium sp. LNJC405B00]|uniref:DUF768 domain-containing protein n=1 Tax=unclassified Mesorhizobium TaxID=325217 RepID=UPI0003CDDECD|nr:DUF768 domain-containing protein [Mesorhizobium sp. LNJC405B00]ESX93214.1 hypothetical protein X755_24905 [Mesorhizobium sp. LNJC405B00]